MSEYGVFAQLVAVVGCLAAAAAAITLAFMKRARWQPPREAVPEATARLSALITMVAIALLFVFGARIGDVGLAIIAVVLLVVALIALRTSIRTNTTYSFDVPAPNPDDSRVLGGHTLTDEARDIVRRHKLTESQLLADAKFNKDLVWTRDSQADIQSRSAFAFIALIGAGSSCLAAVGMLVALFIGQSGTG